MDLYKKSDRKFREEIEGLRAIAALLVAVYHIWSGKVSGGVDVFFVVAGFLITLSLLSRYEKKGKIDPIGFGLNLSKRLFPAAFTVMVVIIIGCIIWLPALRWDQTIREAIASTIYMENWQLAWNAVDYLAQHNEASPFQHFWAMSVQGQFYIIWPTLILFSLMISKLFKRNVRFTFLVILIMVFITSFAYSVYITALNQPWAYFDTFARVWEFSLGGITALLIANISLPRIANFILGWIGVIGLISCGLVIQVSTVFPGYAALWPTLCAVFILVAGNGGGRFGSHLLLSSKPLMKFGGISYGFYLWHWPILIFYYLLSGNEKANFIQGLAIILLSWLMAYLTTKYIETPIRKGEAFVSRRKVLFVSSGFFSTALALSVAWGAFTVYLQNEGASLESDKNYPGAQVMASASADQISEEQQDFIPRPIQARDDLPKGYKDGCHQGLGKSEVLECEYGKIEKEDYTIALVGGSHSAHWLPALEKFAMEENIKILNYTKSGCRFTVKSGLKEDCLKWNEDLMEMLINKKPDLVFTTADIGVNLREFVPPDYIERWERLQEHDIPVFAVRDNPYLGFDVPKCVDENGPDSPKCSVSRDKVVLKDSPWSKLENPPNNVHYADFTDFFCTKTSCEPIVGNILVYRDRSHITATFAESLSPFVREEVMAALHES